jgi:hypothetical protein
VRAIFFSPDAADVVVGSAVWRAGRIHIEADDESIDQVIRRIFRSTPVAIDDPSMRSYGASGPVVLSPGSLRWFRAAADVRAQAEGLGVRFVPESEGAMGWDPAGSYRTFNDAIERMDRIGNRPGTEPVQPDKAVAGAARS